jgi:Tfp pilus assembly protein PilN
MFRPVAFDPYGRRRTHRRVPRWLLLLGAGVLAGAAGVLLVQHQVLPPRLSAAESTRLQSSYAQADAERTRLQQTLTETQRKLDTTLAERQRLQQEAQQGRQAVARLREELGSLVAALPPDPRGGAVQVRSAKFSTGGGKLHYDVMLSRSGAASAPLNAVMQLVVAGSTGKGPETRVRLEPVPLQMSSFESLKGGLPLPEGFDPRQATVNVLDQPQGKLLGMRVMAVK